MKAFATLSNGVATYKYNDLFTAAKRGVDSGRVNHPEWRLRDDLGIEYPHNEWSELANHVGEVPIKESKVLRKEDIYFTLEEISREEFIKGTGRVPEDKYSEVKYLAVKVWGKSKKTWYFIKHLFGGSTKRGTVLFQSEGFVPTIKYLPSWEVNSPGCTGYKDIREPLAHGIEAWGF